jgi:hypothetical protein
VDVVAELEPNGASTSIRRPRFRGAFSKSASRVENPFTRGSKYLNQTTEHTHGIGHFRILLGRIWLQV